MAARDLDKPVTSGSNDSTPSKSPASKKTDSRVNGQSSDSSNEHDVPNWRRIEIMRERQQLKRHLQEVWDDDTDLEDAFDLDDADHDRFYTKGDDLDVDIDEDMGPLDLDDIED